MNLYTQITNIVNNFQIEVTPELLKEFKKGYNSDTYSSYKNYEAEWLEFGLRKAGLGYQKNWKQDIIFPFAPEILIDLKLQPSWSKNISIKESTRNYGEHMNTFGSFKTNIEHGIVASNILNFELTALIPKEIAHRDMVRQKDKYGNPGTWNLFCVNDYLQSYQNMI